MLGFDGSPWMVNLEALVAEAGTAIHAAFCGFLDWRFAKVTHDGSGSAGRLSVAFYYSLQSKVSKKAINASLSKVHIT